MDAKEENFDRIRRKGEVRHTACSMTYVHSYNFLPNFPFRQGLHTHIHTYIHTYIYIVHALCHTPCQL